MISSTAEYALRAVVRIAQHGPGPMTAQDVAKAAHIPPHYASKILEDLAEAGLLVSRRGPGGGYGLARPPDRIDLLSVINAVDPIKRIQRCPLGLTEHRLELCSLHAHLDRAIGLIEDAFRRSTLSDMLVAPAQRNACAFPRLNLGPAAEAGRG
jgi:Rrf2 family protein